MKYSELKNSASCEWHFIRGEINKAKLFKVNDFEYHLVRYDHLENANVKIETHNKRVFIDKFTAFDLLKIWGYNYKKEL
jgi:uncharacterized surface protein with fasciclin (FAS1) repeats